MKTQLLEGNNRELKPRNMTMLLRRGSVVRSQAALLPQTDHSTGGHVKLNSKSRRWGDRVGLSAAFLCNGAQTEEKRVTLSSGGRYKMFGRLLWRRCVCVCMGGRRLQQVSDDVIMRALTSWWSRRPASWVGRRCADRPGWGSRQRSPPTGWCTGHPRTWPSVSPRHTGQKHNNTGREKKVRSERWVTLVKCRVQNVILVLIKTLQLLFKGTVNTEVKFHR